MDIFIVGKINSNKEVAGLIINIAFVGKKL